MKPAPQIVFMEDENNHESSSLMQVEYVEADSSIRIEAMEARLMRRISVLEELLQDQNQKIDLLMTMLSKSQHLHFDESEGKRDIYETEEEEEWLYSVEESTDTSKNTVTYTEIPIIVECIEEGQNEQIVYDVVKLNKRSNIEICQITNVKSSRVLPKLYEMPEFPIDNIDLLRGFNKALATNDEMFRLFVELIHNLINDVDIDLIPEKIITHIISMNVLKQSTWASKANGRLRIGNLDKILKCILQELQPWGIHATKFRTRTINLLQRIKAQNT